MVEGFIIGVFLIGGLMYFINDCVNNKHKDDIIDYGEEDIVA